MNISKEPPSVETIPISKISVLNPRARNRKVFQQIVDSISKVGLKKPITVSLVNKSGKEVSYDLVCGQGRLEAFMELGEKFIPAIILDVGEEDRLVMSLVENLARRRHLPLELINNIGHLSQKGYSTSEIAEKTGLTNHYILGILKLIEKGEERLLMGVETGKIPISIATLIADTEIDGAQEALRNAYESVELKGKKLLSAKKLITLRQRHGKNYTRKQLNKSKSKMSSSALIKAYNNEADKQKLMIKKSNITQSRLLFMVEAMNTLLSDENFVNSIAGT